MSGTPPVLVVIVVVRLVLWAFAKARAQGEEEAPAKLQPVAVSPGFWGVILAVFVWTPGLVLCGFVLAAGGVWVLPGVLVFAILSSPQLVARYVSVPLGLVRATRLLLLLPTVTWSRDRRGGAELMAAWALLRARGPAESACAWLEGELAKGQPLRGAGIVASGLLLARQRDLEGARAVLASVETIDPRVRPEQALRIAREWRAVEALARGAWSEVEDVALLPGARSRLVRLLGALAAHEVGARSLSPLRGWALWLHAPRRRHTRARVAETLRRTPGESAAAPPPPVEVSHEVSEGTLAAALRLHAAVLGRDPSARQARDARLLGARWDAALRELTEGGQLRARAQVLGAVRWEAALGELSRAAEAELAAVIRAAAWPLADLDAPGGSLGDRARRTVRHELLTEVELAASGLRARCAAGRALGAPDEWRDWLERRRTFDRAFARGGLEVLRLSFPVVHPAVCDHAVWLYNERGERALANALFTWLLGLARAAEDAEAVQLAERNAACRVL